MGRDTLYGGENNDTIYGDEDNDYLKGEPGADTLYGGMGNDTIYGDEDDDYLKGEAGADTLYGGTDNDVIYGDEDNDRLFGEGGSDTLLGGGGDDILTGGLRNDTIDGGTNSAIGDLVVFNNLRSYYNVTTSNGVTTVKLRNGDETDTVTNVEYFQFESETFDINHVNDVDYLAQGTKTIVPVLEKVTTPTIVNQTPIITGISSVSKSTNQSFGFTSLINASDPDGTVAYYKFSDTNPGAGYLTQNNLRISGTSVKVSAANLGQIGYFTDSTTGSNQIAIEAIDNLGKASPNYLLMTINVGTTNIPPPPSPVATSLPEIYISDFSLAEGDSGTRNATVKVHLNKVSNTNVSFKYMVVSKDSVGWAKFGTDFELQAGTLSISAGSTFAEIKIPVIGDTKIEGNESLNIILSSATGAVFSGGLPLYSINGTIRDDDAPASPPPPPPPVSPAGPIYLDLNADDVGLVEGTDGIYTEFGFDVIRTGDLSVATKFRWEVQGYGADPATADDFVGSTFPTGTGTLVIGDGKETFTVRVKGDLTNEPNESFRVKLYAASPGVKVTDSTEMVTIRNDDGTTPPPSAGAVYVSIRPYDAVKSEGTVTNGQTTFVFELTREGDLSQETQVSVGLSVMGATPQANTLQGDFVASAYTATFAIGESTVYRNFYAKADSVSEPNEPFKVSLSSKSGYDNVEFVDRYAQGMILNDDGPAPPLVTAPSISIRETDSNQTAMLRVQLSATTSVPVSMNYAVYVYASSNLPSTSGADFTPITGSVTIQPGSTYANIPVTILGDNVAEGIEVVDVRLSNLVNGYFGRSISEWDTSVIILDDDGGVKWPGNGGLASADYIDLGTLSPYSSQRVDYWLDATVPQQLFRFGVDEPMAVLGSAPLVFSSDGKLIYSDVSRVDNIEIVDTNGAIGLGMTFQPGVPYFLLFGADGSSAGVSQSLQLSGVPTENKLPLLMLGRVYTSPGGFDAGVEGQGVYWSVDLSQIVEHDITFDFELRSLSAEAKVDFSPWEATSGTITLLAGDYGNSKFIGLNSDTLFEGDEQFEVVIKNVSGAVLANGASEISKALTILDDDPSPVPVFVIKALTVDRAEGSVTNGKFIFEISRPYGGSDVAGDVNWAVTGAGSNQATASDFVSGVFPSGKLTFAAGEVSKTLVVEVSPDTVAELDESFKVELSNPSSGLHVFNGNVLGTIRNDDGVYVPGYLGNNVSEAAISYEMAAGDTTFLASGVSAIDVAGNALANHIFGNNAANWIEGREGDDSIIAGDGNDTLDGGTGADNLEGGRGDDIYYVDNLYDDVFELPDRGMDVVYASVDHELFPNVEKLFLTGTLGISGAGNELANTITGNDQANLLAGRGGSDILIGGGGNDTIDGGLGNDNMSGGAGNDTYLVDNASDVVTESASNGTDLIQSYISIAALAANVEHFTLLGNGNLSGVGNNLANTMTGNAGNNVLTGLSGNDTLDGGEGADQAVYSGKLANYTVTATKTGYTVTDKMGSEGIDTLINIEKLVFADQTKTLSIQHAPTLATPPTAAYTNTSGDDTFAANTGILVGSDPDGDALIYGIVGGTLNNGKVIKTGVYGTLAVNTSTGAYTFAPNEVSIEGIKSGTDEQFTVTVSDGSKTSSATYAVKLTVTPSAPTGSVTISGTPTQGQTLTAANTLTDADGLGAISYQWKANGANISGATNSAYILTASEVGKTITVAASYIDGFGTAESVTSSATGTVANIVTPAPVTTPTPTPPTPTPETTPKTPPANQAPVAVADSLNLSEDNILKATGSLLSNDTDPDSADLISLISINNLAANIGLPVAGQYGELIVKADGSYTYQLDNTLTAIQGLKIGQNLTETFSYTIKDVAGLQSSANINISIAGQNDAPVAHNDGYTYVEGSGALAIKIDDLLGNDSHPDTGSKITLGSIGTAESGATLTLDAATGIISYNPGTLFDSLNAGQKGSDRFTYTLTDANGGSATGTVNLTVIGTTLAEGAAPAATGGKGADVLISADGGDLSGGKGNDTYIIDQEGQAVQENLNEGNDTVITTLATYTLGDNVENLNYTGLNDFNGIGNSLNNSIEGNIGNDSLKGESGIDTLKGNAGNDTLDGGTGADSLYGGAGDDIYLIDNAGDKVIELDGEGVDLIHTTLSNYSIAALINIENLDYTGTGNFTGTGNTGNNMLTGNTGKDSLNGGAGDDSLNGGADDDKLLGGEGNDTLNGGEGSDSLDGGKGDDTLIASAGNDTLIGGDGTDTLDLTGINFLFADKGKSTGFTVSREAKNILITDNETGQKLSLNGIENITFVDGTFTLDQLIANTASNQADTYTGGDSADAFDGLGGDDIISGGGGDDTLTGGLGKDTLDGGTGSDILTGGVGDDIYVVDTDQDPAKGIAGDSIIEAFNEGTDKVRTSLTSYILGDNVENLEYIGSPAPAALLDSQGKVTGETQSQQLAFTGNSLNNTIEGNNGSDSLAGGEGVDTLKGNAGNDILEGGKGADKLYGGAGDDTYLIDSAGDKVVELAGEGTDMIKTSLSSYSLATVALAEVENLEYIGNNGVIANFTGTGNTGNNIITGNTGKDSLNGGAGDDTLNGGDGNDSLDGGKGDDTLIASLGNDTLNGGDGTDSLDLTGISFLFTDKGKSTGFSVSRPDAKTVLITDNESGQKLTLGGIENYTFSDGTYSYEQLIANTASDSPDTYIGDDSAENFNGYAGDDVISGGGGDDSLDGGKGIDVLNGDAGNDTLTGGTGKDTLDGGTGSDAMTGGLGDDTYVVDTEQDPAKSIAGDSIIENLNEGTDKVKTSLISYTLGDNIEKLEYIGTPVPVLDGQGNATAETQIQLLNFTGTGNSLNNTIEGNSGNDMLIGGDGVDTLKGNAGNDSLDGGAGADFMTGGLGDDTYSVDTSGDKVIEKDAQGNDTGGSDRVKSSITYSLKDNLENLTLTGSSNINGTGNQLDNSLTGNEGDNSLKGSDGNDTLDGGAGNDKLDGGTGIDVLLGGLGDDILIYDSTDSKIDGGAGISDLLKLSSSGITLDLNQLTFGKISNIEKLDLTGTGNNSLIVNNTNLANLTGSDGHDLYVTGNAGDSVTINTKTGAMWEDSGITNINGVNYHQYIQITGAQTDHIYVLDTLTQTLV